MFYLSFIVMRSYGDDFIRTRLFRYDLVLFIFNSFIIGPGCEFVLIFFSKLTNRMLHRK